MKLTEDEQKVLLALSELEPASLQRMSATTGIELRRLKVILETLAKKGLLKEANEDSKNGEDGQG